MLDTLTAIICLSLVLSTAGAMTAGSPRSKTRMDANWLFHKGDFSEFIIQNGTLVTNWQWKTVDNPDTATPDNSTEGWISKTGFGDVFGGRKGYVWYRATLPRFTAKTGNVFPKLFFECIDDNGIIFLNGKKLLTHTGWNDSFDISLAKAWNNNGPNELMVLAQNTEGEGGITKPVYFQTSDSTKATGANGPVFDDHAWQKIHLPHDFIVSEEFDETSDPNHGFKPPTIGWYRKTFILPENLKGKRIVLEFDGVYRRSSMWINGHSLGTHNSGYTSFSYEITDQAKIGGKNVISDRVDASSNEGWWYEGAGIYRHVWLTVTEPLHVKKWGTFVISQLAEPKPDQKPGPAQLTIETTLENQSDQAANCQVLSRILMPGGKLIAENKSQTSVKSHDETQLNQSVQVPEPLLWSLQKRNIYTLETIVSQNGHITDRYTTPFGIRTIRFDADKGFFLNGLPVKIQGTCNHQDFAGIGVALPDRAHYYKIEKLIEMGSNGYRCSHHPFAPEIYDACDKMGMVVMDENRRLGDSPQNLDDVASMVLRDRNHPSIIIWSMCNEERLQGTQEAADMYAPMIERVHQYDTTRPVTCAMNGGWGFGLSLVVDLQGCNYGSASDYDDFHKKFPLKPMLGSETASTVTTRGIYANDGNAGYVTAYNATDWSWKAIYDRPFMAGSFVWTGFDYRGEPYPYKWPCINSHFGIMDTCGFPKDNYYYYTSWWGHEPSIHLMPHWNWKGKEGQSIDVRCFSNCDEVELFLNGKSMGAKVMPVREHLDWQIPYQSGTLTAKGYIKNKLTVETKIETTGEAASILLKPDRTKMQADGEDLIFVPVTLLDAAGRVMPTADNEVSFTVAGPGKIIGVGNGDPSSHESDITDHRHAFNGHCMVIIQATDKSGVITLKAASTGLKAATVKLQSTPSSIKDVE